MGAIQGVKNLSRAILPRFGNRGETRYWTTLESLSSRNTGSGKRNKLNYSQGTLGSGYVERRHGVCRVDSYHASPVSMGPREEGEG